MAKCAASESVTASPLPLQALEHLTLFCDFDGPIVDVSDRYYHTYRLGLAETQAAHPARSLSPLTKQQFWQMKQERTPDAEIALRSGLQGDQIDRFLQRVVQIVNQPALLQQDQLQPGVKWALALLHAQGVRLVLVTLRCQAQATQILQDHGLAHLFSQVWGSASDSIAYGNLAEHKTALLQQAIATQQSRAAAYAASPSAWMIGDTEADVLAGKAMNVPTIALTCGIRSQTYLQKFEPTRIHSDLLSVAHYLVKQIPTLC